MRSASSTTRKATAASSSTHANAGSPSAMLEEYLNSSPSINEVLWDTTSSNGKSPTDARTKKMGNTLGDWQKSWDGINKKSSKGGSSGKDSEGRKRGSKRHGSSKDSGKK
ncbi:hypothetical protein CPLU01_11741 [Colletotrichum plurivorum]|uniref:Uncharacterized protein n=1 Tax=Colletotrichum plurivorum TaxID=2175906 RepID=A0A8H6K139_9PEZI|nr:hypothetical protein CPLU01_11741 [Colletotrichum plurivorum]